MRGVAATLVGMALLVGACGGGGGGGDGGGGATADAGTGSEVTPAPTTDAGGGGEGSALDVCAMVPKATVEEILGVPADAGIDNSAVDLRVCSWQGTTEPTEVLTVSIYVHPDPATAAQQFGTTTEGLDFTEILNLGDTALYSDGFGLRVLSGRYDIGIESTGDDEKTSSLKLAQAILPQLP